MKFLSVAFIAIFILVSCSTSKHTRYVMPYLDARLETKNFVDSLKKSGTDTILVYQKKHGSFREYFIFWLSGSELQLRKINSTGVFEIGEWSMNGFYRDNRIFNYYLNHEREIKTDELYKFEIIKTSDSANTLSFWGLPSHYPYVDIDITIDTTTGSYHLPYGVNSNLDNAAFHLARLIESTIYNLENSSHWRQAERKIKWYPKNYDPRKRKWQNWERVKISNGEIWEDYYH